ncbi:MAG: carboxypeptidase-like regulatory domain-containing protein [Terracidiphilus sp.]
MQELKFRSFVHRAVRTVGWTLLAAAMIFPSNRATAQSSSSGVNGVVTDQNGAVVSGAKVALVNAATNVARETVSNGSGNYFFAEVPPAHYMLTFTAVGFQKETIAGFDVVVAQVVTINASLKVGSVQQSVTVQAENTEVESSSAQLGAVIGTQQVNDLPLDGRNFTQLLDLTPGVTPISTGQNSSAGNVATIAPGATGAEVTYTFPSVNGAYNRSDMYLTDGLNNNNSWYNAYAVPPIVDTIQEFKINSHSEAQYGGVIGGVVNVATKSGTNTPHGSAWEFVRTSSFDAKPFFTSPPSYHLNTFGGQMGGPIEIPHVYNGKDKTFYEIGYEGTKFTRANGTPILIPTAAQLGESTFGGASNLTYADYSSASTGVTKNGNCNATDTTADNGNCQLWDPTAGGNFASAGGLYGTGPYRPFYPGNQVPVKEFQATQLAFVKAIFGSNAPYTIPGYASTQYNYLITSPTTQPTDNYMVRIDEHIGTRDFIFARYSGWQEKLTAPSTLPSLFSITSIPAQQYGVSWTHVFSPTTSLQVQYANAHVKDDALTQYTNHNLWQTYGCSADMCDAFVQNIALLVTQTVTGGFSGGETNTNSSNLASVHEWSGSVIRVIGNHQLQAGGGWDEDNYTSYLRQGTVTFSGASTGNFAKNGDSPASITNVSGQAGFGLLDFLLDYPNSEAKRNVFLTERPGGIGSIYVQDSWKMNAKLTVNYGLRYDRSVIPAYGTEASLGLQGSIETGDPDFNTGLYIVQQLPPLCSVRGHAPCLPSATLPADVVVAKSGRILHGRKMNFGPRLGWAYRVNSGLSVRGGIGMLWDNWSALIQMPQNYQGSWPDTGTLQINNTNTPQAGGSYVSAQNPFAANPGNLPAATPWGSSNVNYMVDPLWRNPYSEQFNVGVEKQLWANTILSLDYVGSATHRLDIGGYYNTGTPCGTPCGYASFNARVSAGVGGQPYPYAVPQKSWDHGSGNGTYNSLQTSLRHSFSNGLSYMVSYTWSKTLVEGDDGFFGVEGGVPQDPYNPRTSHGPAGFSIPQMFTANYVYDLPIGTGKLISTGNHVADYIIGGWQWNGIITARSGQAFQVTASGDIAETGNAGTYERANQVGNPYQSGPISANPTCTPPAGGVKTAAQWFNPCAFVTPSIGSYGTTSRYPFIGPTYWDYDTSLQRQFPIHDTLGFSIQAQAFNAFNHPVLGNPGTSVNASTGFGVITGTASTQRIVQLSGKLYF